MIARPDSHSHSPNSLPYGIHDLEPQPNLLSQTPKRVRCYVRGCRHELVVPGGGELGEVCPDHGIRCHYSFSGFTYSYADAKRNAIASPQAFGRSIIGNPHKYESHRLGLERSEDTLSWNVFRSLQEAGALAALGEWLTGQASPVEPNLYLWSVRLTNDDFGGWNLLEAVRRRFEKKLPVKRPATEPDIALHLPGRYLILIEAKFTSENMFYAAGPRKDAKSLTLDELRTLYWDDRLQILDYSMAQRANRIFYQLWRNMIFAEWMAQEDHAATKAYHLNLVRQGFDADSAAEFHGLVRPDYRDRFRQITWEQIAQFSEAWPALDLLRRYLATKTEGLQKAFKL